MIDTTNNPSFDRYVFIDDLYFRIGVREGKLEEIQDTEEYRAFECMLLEMAASQSSKSPENG